MSENTIPDWADPDFSERGNVRCATCGTVQAEGFPACIECCQHSELRVCEDWDHSWRLAFCCAACGKDFGFSNRELIENYKSVRVLGAVKLT